MKKTTVTLSGGQLVLGPLLAATLRENAEQIRAFNAGELDPMDMVALAVTLGTAAAQRVNPAITAEHVEQLVDLENFSRVVAGCWGVSVPEGDADAKKPVRPRASR